MTDVSPVVRASAANGGAFDLKAVDKFGGNMLGICGTAAVAEKQDFAPRRDAGRRSARAVCNRALEFCVTAVFLTSIAVGEVFAE